MLSLNNLRPAKGARKRRKLKGRGIGSGHGKTSTRGHKGQKARTGRSFYLGFEGGQIPFIQKIPKRGFTSYKKKRFQIINIDKLKRFEKDGTLGPGIFKEKGLIDNDKDLVKILGKDKLSKPVTVEADAFSKSARRSIEEAGGKVIVRNA